MNSKDYYLKKRNSLPNSEDRNIPTFSFEELDMLQIKNIHFTAVCGKAMASLAGMLVDAGYKVTGSDCECYSPMFDIVKESGVEYQNGFNASHIHNADIVVMGNACMFSNEEAVEARKLNKPQISVAEALHYFILKNKKSIVVTGTHGKTTTTSYLTEAFNYLHLNPSFLVGGVVQNFNTSYHFDSQSKFIIVEGDEYDCAYFDKRPKFFHYDPYILIITSIEFDHADIFHDEEDYKNAFKMLLQEKKKEGVVIACVDDKNIETILKEVSIGVPIFTYGIKNGEYRAENIRTSEKGQLFDVVTPHYKISDITIPLFGDHNIKNSLSVLISLLFLDVDIDKIKEALFSFKGVKERQEKLGETNSIVIVRDYAHHPTAVKETIIGLRRQYPNKRIVMVFEPRSTTSRKKMFEIPYAESFLSADVIILKEPIKRLQDNENDFMSISSIEKYIVSRNRIFISDNSYEDLLNSLIKTVQKEDLVVFMSNGDFGGLPFQFLEKISSFQE